MQSFKYINSVDKNQNQFGRVKIELSSCTPNCVGFVSSLQ